MKRRKARPRRVAAVCAFVVRRSRALAVRRAPGGLLGGLWELPGGDVAPRETAEAALARALRARLGLEARAPARLGRVDHLFSHRALALHVFRVEAPTGRLRLAGFEAHRWSAPAALAGLPMSAVMRKALSLAAP